MFLHFLSLLGPNIWSGDGTKSLINGMGLNGVGMGLINGVGMGLKA